VLVENRQWLIMAGVALLLLTLPLNRAYQIMARPSNCPIYRLLTERESPTGNYVSRAEWWGCGGAMSSGGTEVTIRHSWDKQGLFHATILYFDGPVRDVRLQWESDQSLQVAFMPIDSMQLVKIIRYTWNEVSFDFVHIEQ
jgi:hypothetical protein